MEQIWNTRRIRVGLPSSAGDCLAHVGVRLQVGSRCQHPRSAFVRVRPRFPSRHSSKCLAQANRSICSVSFGGYLGRSAMGFVARKSFKVMPGVRMTVSKSGLSASAGVPGARVTKSTSGRTTRTVGVPGTGVYHTKSTSSGQSGSGSRSQAPAPSQVAPRRQQSRVSQPPSGRRNSTRLSWAAASRNFRVLLGPTQKRLRSLPRSTASRRCRAANGNAPSKSFDGPGQLRGRSKIIRSCASTSVPAR